MLENDNIIRVLPLFVKEIKDGIILLSDGTYVTIVGCEGRSLWNTSPEEKNALLKVFGESLGAFNFPYSLYVRSKLERYEKYIENLVTDETDWRKDQLEEHKGFIKNLAEQTRLVSKEFFITIPFKLDHPIDFTTGSADIESVVRVELDKRINTVIDAFSQAGIRGWKVDTSKCIDLMAETLRLGTDMYKENQEQFTKVEEKFSNMAAGIEPKPTKEVTLTDLIAPKKIELKKETLFIEGIVVKTFELSGGKTDFEEWFNTILFLDRPFMVAFHSVPVEVRKKSGFHMLITLEGTQNEITETENTLASIYTTSGITTKIVSDQITGFLSTRAFLGTDFIFNSDSPQVENVFPFVQESLMNTQGIMYGANRRVSNLVVLDRFQLSFGPQHSIVLGSDGTGKTYFTKTEAIRYAHRSHANILFVDLFGQYERFARSFKTPFTVVDMSVEKPERPFFMQPTRVEVYSFSKITSPDAKIEAVNAFLEFLATSISSSTQQERCLIVFNELSAGYSDEKTLKRIAEIMDLHKNSISMSLIVDNFSYIADSVFGNEILINAGLRFIFRQELPHESKRIGEYYGIVDTGILREQMLGEYLLSFNKTIIPVKNITSYTEDSMLNPLTAREN